MLCRIGSFLFLSSCSMGYSRENLIEVLRVFGEDGSNRADKKYDDILAEVRKLAARMNELESVVGNKVDVLNKQTATLAGYGDALQAFFENDFATLKNAADDMAQYMGSFRELGDLSSKINDVKRFDNAIQDMLRSVGAFIGNKESLQNSLNNLSMLLTRLSEQSRLDALATGLESLLTRISTLLSRNGKGVEKHIANLTKTTENLILVADEFIGKRDGIKGTMSDLSSALREILGQLETINASLSGVPDAVDAVKDLKSEGLQLSGAIELIYRKLGKMNKQ